MTESIALPLWIAIAIGLLALWAVLDRLLIPGVRRLFRRRTNRAFEELNARLALRIPEFHRI